MKAIRTAAILLGVNRSPGLSRLKNAENDAVALARFFRGPYGPVAPENVHIATGAHATRRWLKSVTASLARRPPDVLFVAFSGHGSSEAIALADGLVSHAQLAQAIRGVGASRVAVMIDACHAGAYASQHGYARLEGLPDDTWQNALAESMPGARLLLAARPSESASDGQHANGAFTHALLRALHELPGDLIIGHARFITAEAAFQRAMHLVRSETKGAQWPQAFGHVADFPLARPAMVVGRSAQPRAAPSPTNPMNALSAIVLVGLGMFAVSRLLK